VDAKRVSSMAKAIQKAIANEDLDEAQGEDA
jgi:hypothetical protein